jgi:hypothetical protein
MIMPQIVAFLSGMTAQAWSALVATIALVVTAGFQIAGWRRDRLSRGVDAVRAMDSRWESTEFREQRKRAAAFLISKDEADDAGRDALFCLLNLFETLGFFLDRKIADAETIWHFFGSWLLPYCVAAQGVIVKERAHDPSVYCELQVLFEEVCKVERKTHPSRRTDHLTSESEVLVFLREEQTLSLTPRPSTTPL